MRICLFGRTWQGLLSTAILPGLVGLTGCVLPNRDDAASSQSNVRGAPQGPISVDVARAELRSLQQDLTYVGTTAPSRTVELRARLDGQLMTLRVDAGDRVTRGQVLGRIDDDVLVTRLLEARSELAARQSDIAQARARVQELRTQVEESRLQWQQANTDAQRLLQLNRDGAVATQMAEQAQTAARTAMQSLRSAQAQVRTQQQAVVASQKRASAQEAVIAQIQALRSQAVLVAPMTGQVVERMSEPGNLVQTGGSVLTLGAFNPLKIRVRVSELDLTNIRVGQAAEIRLDALPEETWTGQVARIPPRADPTARQVPVELLFPNPGGRLTSGLLARVRFIGSQAQQVVVPQTALQTATGRGATAQTGATPQIFILNRTVQPPTVSTRAVTLGQQRDDLIEIKSGLRPGESFVVRSGRPLTDGAEVKLSILSQPNRDNPRSPTPQ